MLADTTGTTALGAIAGLAGGIHAAGFVDTLLFEVTPLDTSNVALPLATLAPTALVAAVIPAWRRPSRPCRRPTVA